MEGGDRAKIRALALEMLARREHSAWELRRKLIARGYVSERIETVLEELYKENLQNDQRFVESYIHSRVERGFGPRRIAAELKQRGISDPLIANCLKETVDDWYAQATEVRRKRFGQPIPSNPKERARQIRFLQYRGFTQEQVTHVLSGSDD